MSDARILPFGNFLLVEPVPDDGSFAVSGSIHVPSDVRIGRGRVLEIPVHASRALDELAERLGMQNPLVRGAIVLYRVREKKQIRVGRNLLITQRQLIAYEAPRQVNQ